MAHRFLARRGFTVEAVTVNPDGTAVVVADRNPAAALRALDPAMQTRRAEVVDALDLAETVPDLRRVLRDEILPRLVFDDDVSEVEFAPLGGN